MIHYANIQNSPRLQRVLSVLADGREHTTMQIIQSANVCAVNTIAAELRRNGYLISAKSKGMHNGSHIYAYRWAKKD